VAEHEINNGVPDEADFTIMEVVERQMSEEKLYTDTTLSLDSLAQKLDIKRHYLSEAINRCTKKSFNTFINEYRIKEAIRLLSKSDAKNFSIDQIAFDSGFNNRISFHRVFKKITGLSPTEFRKNVVDG
jgi:YesN/AraC family two-component response regulator